MSHVEPITKRATGKWQSILLALGMDRVHLTGKHAPCPMCGGKDRFRFINRNGSGDWHCNQCSHDAGMGLVIRFLKIDFKAAAEAVERVLGSAVVDARQKASPDATRAREAARRLWQSSLDLQGPALVYLQSRGLPIPLCGNVRYMPKCTYAEGRFYPALLAKITDAKGEAINLQKTFIERSGMSKARVENPYQMMRGPLPPGSAIRLGTGIPKILGIAEGMATAMSAHKLFDIQTWAVLNANGIKRFVVPEGVEELVIMADADSNYTGQAAAYERANRAVIQDKIKARVMVPEILDYDWNDVLLSRQEIPRGMEAAE